MSDAPPALVSVAGNLDPARVLPDALRRLDAVAPVRAVSRFWVTPAMDRPEQPDYWNGVAAVDWEGSPDALRSALRTIEAELGRVRTADKWAARAVDLDVLRAGDFHDPEVLERPWLVRGVLDVAPDAVWPGWGPLSNHPKSGWDALQAPFWCP